MAFTLTLTLPLSLLVAWYSAKSTETGQIDVDRGTKVFLLLAALAGWGCFAHERYTEDQRLEDAQVTMRQLIAIAAHAGAEVDTARAAVDDVLGRLGR